MESNESISTEAKVLQLWNVYRAQRLSCFLSNIFTHCIRDTHIEAFFPPTVPPRHYSSNCSTTQLEFICCPFATCNPNYQEELRKRLDSTPVLWRCWNSGYICKWWTKQRSQWWRAILWQLLSILSQTFFSAANHLAATSGDEVTTDMVREYQVFLFRLEGVKAWNSL